MNKKPSKRARHNKIAALGGSLSNPNFVKLLDARGDAEQDQALKNVSDASFKGQQQETIDGKSKVTQDWRKLMKKDQLTPMEMMQEAAFTELINKESLE